ncbi:hypothetical protein WEI85_32210 [Actinomycetes bacterium KLBMP 9797]
MRTWMKAAGAVALVVVATTPGTAAATTMGSGWRIDDVPLDAVLYDAASGGSATTWAVGALIDDNFTALALRWDGRGWARTAVPVSGASRLDGVDVVNARTVWAVGSADDHTLAARWDGLAWRTTPTQDTPGMTARLVRVDAVSDRAAWAVGSEQALDSSRGLVYRWDGRLWSRVPLPDADLGDYTLAAVHARSATDVWIAGHTYQPNEALLLHWDGHRWTRAALPSFAGVTLESVVARSTSEVWALGWTHTGTTASRRPLALRFDGREWTVVPSPDDFGHVIDAVVHGGAVWAGGYGETPSLARLTRGWTPVPTPELPEGTYFGVTVVPGRGLLAVGARWAEDAPRPLIVWHPLAP